MKDFLHFNCKYSFTHVHELVVYINETAFEHDVAVMFFLTLTNFTLEFLIC